MGFLDSFFSKKQPVKQNYPALNPNDPGDICSALSCLIGHAVNSVPYDSDGEYGMLLVRIVDNSKTTEIYASCSLNKNWIKNSRDINEYRKINVPEYIAEFLCQIPFESGAHNLKIVLNGVPNSSALKRRIDESQALMPQFSNLYFKSKAYFIEGTRDFCIDLDIAKD